MNTKLSLFRPSDLFSPLSAQFFGAADQTMPVDIEDTGAEWRIKADLPGISKEDVDVSLDNDVLTIKASFDKRSEDKSEDEQGKLRYLVTERHAGEVRRSFRLGAGIDNESIAANLSDGVLTVTVAKPSGAKGAGKIEVT